MLNKNCIEIQLWTNVEKWSLMKQIYADTYSWCSNSLCIRMKNVLICKNIDRNSTVLYQEQTTQETI